MMAELSNLESKLGEVLGLAQAAKGATDTVKGMFDGESSELVASLERMHEEAAETEEPCTEVVSSFDGKKTAILEKAREVKGEATEMMKTYLSGEDDPLDGFEFLTMAEAGEVGHWAIVGKLNERASNPGGQELVDWRLPIKRRHFDQVMAGSLELAGSEDPNEVAD